MNTDSYFEIGSSHAICEDYALDGSIKDMHYVIGADGCSSSNGVDIGSKLLCHIAKSSLISLMVIQGAEERIRDQDWVKNFSNFIRMDVIGRCRSIASDLHLDYRSFDATLLMAIAKGRELAIAAWGDGVIIEKMNDFLIITEISYEGNAPFYLSYYFDADRMSQYKLEHGGNKKVVRKYFFYPKDDKVTKETRIIDPFEPYFAVINTDTLQSLSICSDGIETYYDNENKELKMIDFAKEYVDYKSCNGEFVKRRMNRIKRDSKKTGIIHMDDIFCGTINLLGDK